MTSKTTHIDLRVKQVGYMGTGYIGLYFDDFQSGGNRPQGSKGIDAVTPHNYTRVREAFLNPSVTFWYDTNPSVHNWILVKQDPNSLLGSASWQSGWGPNDDLVLLSRLKDKVMSNDFNVLITVGEFHKTCDMIAYAARRLSLGIRALRRLDFRTLRRMFGAPNKSLTYRGPPRPEDLVGFKNGHIDLSQIWLEYSYGWRPLVKDIYDGAEKLSDLINRKQTKMYRARLTRKGNTSAPGRSYVGTQVTRGQVIACIESDPGTAYAIGVTNPAAAFWDLLPYSFVGDWIIPIGEYLNTMGLAAVPGLKWLCTTHTVHVDYRAVWPTSSRIRPVSGWKAYRYRYINMTRSVTNSWSIPFPRLQPLQGVPSVRRALSAVALLVSAFARK